MLQLSKVILYLGLAIQLLSGFWPRWGYAQSARVEVPVSQLMQDPRISARAQLQRSLQFLFLAAHDENPSAASEAARGIWESFYDSSFLYPFVTRGDHAVFLSQMGDQLEAALKTENLPVPYLRILMEALDQVCSENARLEIRQEGRKLDAWAYTNLSVVALDLFRIFGVKAFKRVRDLRRSGPQVSKAAPGAKRTPIPEGRSIKRFCLVGLARMANRFGSGIDYIKHHGRAAGLFVLRDIAIGSGLSAITYPTYFKKFEPYYDSDRVVKHRLRKVIQSWLKEKELAFQF